LRDRYNLRRYFWANITAGSFVLAAVALLAWAFVGWMGMPILSALALVVCVVAFVRQTHHDDAYRRYLTLVQLCEQGLARLQRDWDVLTLRPADTSGLPTLNAADLDILGHASLAHLLNTVTTPLARRRLLGWLLEPTEREATLARQSAVRELLPLMELRDELTLFGALGERAPEAQARFLTWAEDAPWLGARPWLNWYSILSAVALVGLAFAQIFGLLPYPFWLVIFAANMVVMQIAGKDVERQVERVAEEQRAYLPYIGLFGYLSDQRFTASELVRVSEALQVEGESAETALRSLASRMRWSDMRRSIIGPILQLGLLWNVHALRTLEAWRARFGSHARDWFELLSELEALSGLAALAFDNPNWAFPNIAPEATAIEARGLGHPLLPPDRCVGNDVTIGPRGRFLLVTGSNMSGKSTLLRAIGVNVALAQAGAPVCARALRLPPTNVMTSMRIEDSLTQGVSYFMAELRRLKVVVDELRKVAQAGERLPLFLLDEILSGTNSGERRIAARAIIHTLLAMGATGAVSTHDLSLVEEPELRAASVAVHFSEHFTRDAEGPAMSFDYILRPGVATTVNALALMEIAGLPMEYARIEGQESED
jgi:hypothetical protein